MHFSAGEIIGSAGVALLLFAFAMNLLKKWRQEDLSYILLNTVGAGFACVSSCLIRFVPFIILEGIWAIVSLIALVNYFRKRR